MQIVIRQARLEDGPLLREVERLAGERFREVGLADVADDEPPTLETLAAYARARQSWVAVDERDAPIGYVVVDVVDHCAHIEQLSVRPAEQGKGVGRALIDHVLGWAREEGRAAITLTTFTDVPWNAPLYRHLGFRTLGEHELGPELRRLRASEAAQGLDPATRTCMRREVDA